MKSDHKKTFITLFFLLLSLALFGLTVLIDLMYDVSADLVRDRPTRIEIGGKEFSLPRKWVLEYQSKDRILIRKKDYSVIDLLGNEPRSIGIAIVAPTGFDVVQTDINTKIFFQLNCANTELGELNDPYSIVVLCSASLRDVQDIFDALRISIDSRNVSYLK